MARTRRPNQDAEKLRNLLLTLDKLRDAGFIRSHIFINDQHTIQFTERGLTLVQAIQDLEKAIPKLSAGERSGLWHLFRMVELRPPPEPKPLPLSEPAPENRDQAATSRQLTESVAPESAPPLQNIH